MKIIILGDTGASPANVQAFRKPDPDLFSAEIQALCAEADAVLLNPEKPLTDRSSPLGKCPPDYIAPTETINGIKLLHPTAVTLANNHIMDQRAQGLKETIHTLERNNIRYVGAGSNLEEARKPIILTIRGSRIGIYACCEKEFSCATDTAAGANVFDPLETFDDLAALRTQCDYLIVLFHGGMQGYPYPTPYQQKACRKMCDKGADLVVCQHSHIIGCEEKYRDSLIVYGQGNLLLDDVDSESWRNGIILSVTIDADVQSTEIIPTKVTNHKVVIHPDGEAIRQSYYARSKEITDSRFVEKSFADYCRDKLPDYLLKLSGVGSLRRRIISKLKMQKLILRKYHSSELYYILDYFYCDSHREAIGKSIEDRTENKN